MRYYTSLPPLSLQPYVRCFWVLEHDFEAGEQSYVYRSVADGCVEMVFHYQSAFEELTDNGTGHNWLSGIHFQSNAYRRFETKSSFGIFGAYIYPFAIPYLFGIPSHQTSNEMLELDTFLPVEGSVLEEQIMLARDNEERVALLTAFLEKRLLAVKAKDPAILMAIKHVIHRQDHLTVDDLARKYNLSTRQFNRKFKEYSGFNPKLYMRLMRFNRAVKLYAYSKSLSEVAYECGYYDQSHFIHEVKEFTGYHPSFYFSGEAEGTEYRYI